MEVLCEYRGFLCLLIVSLNGSHLQEDFQLLAGWDFVAAHSHVLGVLEGLTVQEANALRSLFLLQAVQQEVKVDSWASNDRTKTGT